MTAVRVSVVIPTRDRPDKLAETLEGLRHQTLSAEQYEVVVVDDGSTPPLSLDGSAQGPSLRCVRRAGGGRSAARNAGVAAAQGSLVVFVDDDISVRPPFLALHLGAQQEWPGALVCGAIRLPEAALATPFGRFRQEMEDRGVPRDRGWFASPGACAAGNQSITRLRFEALGGFDETLASAEDQDLALRHVESGGPLAFLPEAGVVHRDDALDLRRYCRRVERGSESLVAFCRKHPERPENRERLRVHGALDLGREPLALSWRKLLRVALAGRVATRALLAAATAVEPLLPTRLLHVLYRALLGIHIFRGLRRGLASPPPAALDASRGAPA
jgi:glycosyltransferase involved in cell wall biosynthesis